MLKIHMRTCRVVIRKPRKKLFLFVFSRLKTDVFLLGDLQKPNDRNRPTRSFLFRFYFLFWSRLFRFGLAMKPSAKTDRNRPPTAENRRTDRAILRFRFSNPAYVGSSSLCLARGPHSSDLNHLSSPWTGVHHLGYRGLYSGHEKQNEMYHAMVHTMDITVGRKYHGP